MKLKLIENTFVTWLIMVLTAISIFFLIGCPLAAVAFIVIAIVCNVVNPLDREKIQIKYFRESISIEKISIGDWIDLRAAERVEIKKGEYYLIPLGVGMILPHGYEAHVLPRSSTPSKFGIILANSMGIIDNSYSGDNDEWKFPALAIRDTVIEKGDRIAQFRIMKNQPRIEFEKVLHLNKKSRGGIGSTGRR